LYFMKIGIDYRSAPLEIREKLIFSETEVEQAICELNKKDQVKENVILSTCNRTEIFAVVEGEKEGKQDVTEFFLDWFQENPEEILPHLQFTAGEEAIRHAFRLPVGLDSMVLGETQILGQVKQAFLTAMENKTTGKYFNELFRRAITFSKQAHSNTVIGKQAVSLSYVAVQLSKKIFGSIQEKHAVILGAGEMGEASLKNLHGAGVSKITIVNRSHSKARQLADRFQAETAELEKIDKVLVQADILISSTGAEDVLLTKERLSEINSQRSGKPLLLIDLAVPRDIAEDARELDHVFLYDVDDLKEVTDENIEKRKEAAAVLEREIDNELAAYKEWLSMQQVVPILQALHEKSARIQEQTLDSIYRKIPDLDEREKKVLQKHTKSMIHQLLEQPVKQVKQIGMADQSEEVKAMYQMMFVHTFGLEDAARSGDQK